MKPVYLVVGAGAGIGGTVGKRFAEEGYHSVLCRRSDEGYGLWSRLGRDHQRLGRRVRKAEGGMFDQAGVQDSP